jgi:hypothetical protein
MHGTKLPLPLFFNFLFTYLFSIIIIPYYISFSFIYTVRVHISTQSYDNNNLHMSTPGADSGGSAPGAPPPKIGKNMNFWRKIVIFHTKYPKNFRASLRLAQFF